MELGEIFESIQEEVFKIRCDVCKTYHQIDTLMRPPTPKPDWQHAFTELANGQKQILQEVKGGFDSLGIQLQILMSQADEQFEALITTLTDPAKDGPRLFSFEPVDQNRFNPQTWVNETFRLILWCEHSKLPLTLLNDEGDTQGIYKIKLKKEWVRKAAPVLRIISVTLKLVFPIVLPGAKLAMDDNETSKAINKQLDFGIKSSGSFLNASDQAGDWLGGETTEIERSKEALRAQGSILRELHTILKKEDPNFGGLVRVQNKRREFLWVHPQFVDLY